MSVLAHLQHSEVFQDALLHLLHAIVVAVQLLLGPGDVGVVASAFVPRQTDDRLQVLELHVVVGRLDVDAVQLRKLLVEDFGRLLAPMLCSSLVLEVGHVFLPYARLVLVAQLALYVLHLLAKEVLALLLVEVATRLVFYLSLELHQLDDVVGKLDGMAKSLQLRWAGEQLILLFDAERQVAAYRIEHEGRWLHVVYVLHQLVGIVIQDAHQPPCTLLEHRQHSPVFGHLQSSGHGIGQTFHRSFVASAHQPHVEYLDSVESLEERVVGSVGHLHGMHELSGNADGVEVFGLRSIHLGSLLRQQCHHAVSALYLAQRLNAVLAAHGNGRDGSGEEYIVAKGDDRHLATIACMYQLVGLARYLRYKGECLFRVLKHSH